MPVKYSNKTTSFRHRMAKFKLRKISYKKAIKIIAKNCHLHENIMNSEVFFRENYLHEIIWKSEVFWSLFLNLIKTQMLDMFLISYIERFQKSRTQRKVFIKGWQFFTRLIKTATFIFFMSLVNGPKNVKLKVFFPK